MSCPKVSQKVAALAAGATITGNATSTSAARCSVRRFSLRNKPPPPTSLSRRLSLTQRTSSLGPAPRAVTRWSDSSACTGPVGEMSLPATCALRGIEPKSPADETTQQQTFRLHFVDHRRAPVARSPSRCAACVRAKSSAPMHSSELQHPLSSNLHSIPCRE